MPPELLLFLLALGVYAVWKLADVFSARAAETARRPANPPPENPAPAAARPAAVPPRRPSREELARLAKSRLATQLRMIDDADLQPAERDAAKAKARQQYLRELDRVLE